MYKNELSTGKYSKRELGNIYGIDRNTINVWIRKCDREDLMNTRIMVENLDEISRIKALQKEVEGLGEAFLTGFDYSLHVMIIATFS